MFHEVKVLNPKGKVKRVIKPKKLIEAHWENYKKMEEALRSNKTTLTNTRARKKLKEHPDFMFLDTISRNPEKD